MHTPESQQTLTAAECAARTGLTTRALRLYEEHALIAPRRTASGWRQYGPQELVRLNAITLLKAAGLSLAQIASITRSSPQDLDLQRMLSIQLDNWRARRADAERGQRIAEAALERLGGGGSLTVDDLCSLIRSLEMSQSQDPNAARSDEPDTITLSDAVLDRYAGLYQTGDWNVLTIRREDTKLFIEFPDRAPVELRPTSECDFETVDFASLAITFDQNSDGATASLRMRMRGGDFPAARIDSATAEKVKAGLAARIKAGTSLPGSDSAVRRLVEGLIAGQPNYGEMHPILAYVTRQQLGRLHTTAAYLGAIKSIEFQGVGSRGWDVYDVHQERGTARVRLVLRQDGLVTGALLVVKDGPTSLGP